MLNISCHSAGAFPAASKHNLGQGGAALDEVLSGAHANVALRYLSLSGTTQNIYHSLEARLASLVVTDEQSNRAFKWVIEVLADLASLKAYNPQMSDAEYRQRAKALVRNTSNHEK